MQNDLSAGSLLHIFADGPKQGASAADLQKITETRQLLKEKKWCGEVIVHESKVNKGLANSVIDGVTQVLEQYGKVIVLEDDLVLAKGFLTYMNTALDKYNEQEQVMQVSGHCFPVEKIPQSNSSFFIPLTTSWGWGTWKRAWDKFDKNALGYERLRTDRELEKNFNLGGAYPYSQMLMTQMESGKIDSWAIRWWWKFFLEKGVCLYPDRSLVNNIGFDSEGTHTLDESPFALTEFDRDYFIKIFPTTQIIHENRFEEIKDFIHKAMNNNRPKINSHNYNFVERVVKKLKRIFVR